MAKTCRTSNAEFKAKVGMDAMNEQETINQIASRSDVLPVQSSSQSSRALASLTP